MKNDILQIAPMCMALMFGAAFNSAAAHTLTLDNFSDYQFVSDRGGSAEETANSINLLTGTDLTHASRTFIGLASASTTRAKIEILANNATQTLQIANGPASAGEAAIVWNFDPIDFTRFGNGFLLEISDIDLSVNAEVVVNNTAGSSVHSFSGAGDFVLSFSDFTNHSVFASVSSLRLNLSGPLGWDGSFRLSLAEIPLASIPNTAPVPLPSTYMLMGSVLLGFLGIARKKTF